MTSPAPQFNLTFHGIGPLPPSLDPAEHAVWLPLDAFHSALDAVRHLPNVRLTFDDGNLSDSQFAIPALLERHLTADFFVVAARLNQPHYLSSQDLRELDQLGMRIGTHGMGHRPWRSCSNSQLHEEILLARQILEQNLGKSVLTAACPFGSYDRRVLRWLRHAGFLHVFTSDRGWTHPDAWLQPRNTLHHSDTPSTLASSLKIPPRPFHRAFRTLRLTLKRWR